jgi:alpha-glucosidase
MHPRSGGVDPGRDGCRVPIPWSGDTPPYGFSPPGVETWLPQPDTWAALTVAAQAGDPGSMLRLYRDALRQRRDLRASGAHRFDWLDLGPDVLAFRRGASFVSVTNLSDGPVDLPAGARVRLASVPVEGGRLPADASAWLELA